MKAFRQNLEELMKKFVLASKTIKEKEQLYIEFIKRNSVR